MKHPFELRVDRSQGATRIALVGEVDIAVRETVRDAVTDALSERPAPELVIDLREVTFMDSAGIGELVACHKRAVEKSGTIKILKPNEKLLDLFTITKLIEIFDIYENEKDALKAFA